MSLLQLLTVTRSIKTVKDQPSPYRMKQDHLLPKFSASRTETEVADAETHAPDVRGREEGKAVTDSETSQGKAPGSALAEERRVPQEGFFRRWMPFRRKRRERQRMPVQTELLLEAVKVVRNDFSEEDVFAGGLSAGKAPRPKTRTTAGRWWVKVQSRFLAQRRKPG